MSNQTCPSTIEFFNIVLLLTSKLAIYVSARSKNSNLRFLLISRLVITVFERLKYFSSGLWLTSNSVIFLSLVPSLQPILSSFGRYSILLKVVGFEANLKSVMLFAFSGDS